MPRRELKSGKQVADWLAELGARLKASGNLTLIGSAALLWHAHDRGITIELPEASTDFDPVTDSDEVAMHCYEALIGSEFERTHGWHVNLFLTPYCGNSRQAGSSAGRGGKLENLFSWYPRRSICSRRNSNATNPVTAATPTGPSVWDCSVE